MNCNYVVSSCSSAVNLRWLAHQPEEVSVKQWYNTQTRDASTVSDSLTALHIDILNTVYYFAGQRLKFSLVLT